MEFELPLTEKQKEDILNEVSTVGKLGPAIMIFINLLPELLTIALMIGIFNLLINEMIINHQNIAMNIFRIIMNVCIILGIKYLEYVALRCIIRGGLIEKSYFQMTDMKCVVIDNKRIETSLSKTKNTYTGRREIGSFLLPRIFVYWIGETRVVTNSNNTLFYKKTRKKILEGNREHMAVIEGKTMRILVAASYIDKRYEGLTYAELAKIAEAAKMTSIEELDIDKIIQNSDQKKCLSNGEKLSKDEKNALAMKIFKQLYTDPGDKSAFKALLSRFTILAMGVIFDILIIRLFWSKKAVVYKISEYFTNERYLADISCTIFMVLLIAVELYYAFIRNDISKNILKSSECIKLSGNLIPDDDELISGEVVHNYIFEDDKGDIMIDIYPRDDVYIYPNIPSGRVSIYVCDKMMAVYPEGYF